MQNMEKDKNKIHPDHPEASDPAENRAGSSPESANHREENTSVPLERSIDSQGNSRESASATLESAANVQGYANPKSMEICPLAGRCGGCLYQGVPYEEQIRIKEKQIDRLLDSHEISREIFHGIAASSTPYRYRNKMEYTFGDAVKGGALELGMHEKGRFMSILTCDECQLVPEDFNRILSCVLGFCRERQYSFYHRKTHQGLLRNLIVRKGVRSGELLVNIVTSSEEGFDESGFVQCLRQLELEDDLVGILRTTNDSLADAVINEGVKILYGRDYYYEELLGLRFVVNAFSFFQTNIEAVERLYSEALALLPDLDQKTVYDLYCGTGTIAQMMALRAKKVYGVEIVPDSVRSATRNAELNGIRNCEFLCGDVRKILDQMPDPPDVVVVDPPRAGMHYKAVDTICNYGIGEILYISCNPKTLCINLDQFRARGYQPVYMKAYDNFMMTKHVESVVKLERK